MSNSIVSSRDYTRNVLEKAKWEVAAFLPFEPSAYPIVIPSLSYFLERGSQQVSNLILLNQTTFFGAIEDEESDPTKLYRW